MPSIEWKENLSSSEWDNYLSSLQGHPLQSAQWGNAKKNADHIPDHRWAAFLSGKPVFLARFEDHKLLRFIKIAWAPKGTTLSKEIDKASLQKQFKKKLRQNGYSLCISSPWQQIDAKKIYCDFTIWLDLNIGKDNLWKNLDKQFRYDVRRAEREGIIVEQTHDEKDIRDFYQLCNSISHHKKFNLYGSLDFMLSLINNNTHAKIHSRLFIVRREGKICSGAFIMCCGESIHYMWGGVDRNYAKLRIGEAVQWKIIEWGLENNYKRYDLEGIDLKNNPGTYHFKKKLGGKIVALPKPQFEIIKNRFKIFSPLLYFYKQVWIVLQKYIFKKYIPNV